MCTRPERPRRLVRHSEVVTVQAMLQSCGVDRGDKPLLSRDQATALLVSSRQTRQ